MSAICGGFIFLALAAGIVIGIGITAMLRMADDPYDRQDRQ